MEIWPVDRPTPATCSIAVACAILGISRKTFERRSASGELVLRELERIGRKRRFSGEDVDRYRRGRWVGKSIRRAS